MDPTRNSIRSPQEFHRLPSPAHSSSDSQNRQDLAKLGLEYREEGFQRRVEIGAQALHALRALFETVERFAQLLGDAGAVAGGIGDGAGAGRSGDAGKLRIAQAGVGTRACIELAVINRPVLVNRTHIPACR